MSMQQTVNVFFMLAFIATTCVSGEIKWQKKDKCTKQDNRELSRLKPLVERETNKKFTKFESVECYSFKEVSKGATPSAYLVDTGNQGRWYLKSTPSNGFFGDNGEPVVEFTQERDVVLPTPPNGALGRHVFNGLTLTIVCLILAKVL